ncbi:MAG: sigma-E factor negative regulatory protein [Methylococcales bacterium]|jgi:negative regulator of sigma E activity
MSDKINAQISAFMDDELTHEESLGFLEMISREKHHEDTFHRYVSIREVINPKTVIQADTDFVARVSNVVQDESETSFPDFSEADVTAI